MRKALFYISFFTILAIFFSIETIAFAHCDTLEGPVIQDAKIALKTKNVFPVLKWVPQKNEKEVKQAFDIALQKRLSNQKIADKEFFELLVQRHRESEGESFTGIKPAGTLPSPAVIAADEAIKNESSDALIKEMSNDIAQSIRERFKPVLETKKSMNESIEAGRKYVAAYVKFVHYIEQLHTAIVGTATSTHH